MLLGVLILFCWFEFGSGFLPKRVPFPRVPPSVTCSSTLLDAADFVEVLRLLLAAGEPLSSGFSEALKIVHGSFAAKELGGVMRLQAVGHSFSQSLVVLLPTVGAVSREIVESLLLAQRLGVELGESLEALSHELRERARTAVEDRASKVPTLMLLPLGLFFLPEIALLWLAGAVRDLFAVVAG